jgi:hypothetical protein
MILFKEVFQIKEVFRRQSFRLKMALWNAFKINIYVECPEGP